MIKKIIKSKFWFFFFGFLVAGILALFWFQKVYFVKYNQILSGKKILEKELKKYIIKERIEKVNEKKWKDLDKVLIAKSVYVKKLNGDELYSKNSDSLLPIASLTKIVTAIVGIESGEKEVVLTNRALMSEGEYGLTAYEIFSMKNAIEYMMIESVNDIASAISFGSRDIYNHWRKFLLKMNRFVKKNNIKNTIFFSETGLDINDYILGSYSTAKDIGKITEYFYNKYPDYAKFTTKIEKRICSNKNCHWVKNTNKILAKYPKIDFTKTGYTRKSGGAVSVVYGKNPEKKYIISILGSTKEGRFRDLELIIQRIEDMNRMNYININQNRFNKIKK